jgi:hypothetical protein
MINDASGGARGHDGSIDVKTFSSWRGAFNVCTVFRRRYEGVEGG